MFNSILKKLGAKTLLPMFQKMAIAKLPLAVDFIKSEPLELGERSHAVMIIEGGGRLHALYVTINEESRISRIIKKADILEYITSITPEHLDKMFAEAGKAMESDGTADQLSKMLGE